MALYQQKIMRHYRHPFNRGRLSRPSRKFLGANPFCGDSLEIAVKLNPAGKITAVAWQGQGCAISQAAASILSERLKGLTLKQAANISSVDFLRDLDLELSPTRRKCALLPLYTIKGEVFD